MTKMNSISFFFQLFYRKRFFVRATDKDNNNIEMLGSMNERAEQNWFQYFKEVDTSLEERQK